MRPFSLAIILGTISDVSAWSAVGVHQQKHAGLLQRQVRKSSESRVQLKSKNGDLEVDNPSFDPFNFSSPGDSTLKSDHPLAAPLVFGAASAFAWPSIASAASSAPDAVPSALAAYAHYLSLLVITGSIMTERLTVKPSMTIEEEKRLGYADITVGAAGVALLVSGYYRATQYGKGWDFYSHEPIFWLKMSFLGIFGGLSLFPTILIIQRTVQIQQKGSIEPMSEKLASRMTSVLNAELTALAFIPLTATFMSRGVGYIDGFPTEFVGPAFFGVITAGAVYKYVKDAITWTED